ncbi:6-phosphogluconolactonase [Frigidibacter sp. ROC022]|uniref:6-phosphogluconolactonase n=1 Tax=Frigidibacter sp. ROC022 TaxID=2971796 RepID=UPI00215A24D9|nr:6-phosphogluconolactonase [Frigidibacter sp. ROC022]MCR8726313.1 6-phosphogluconolactonase [Frigidibacter sp. ROC022]
MKMIEYPDRDFLFMRAADMMASELRAALGHEERVSFGVPGGTTPGPIFDTLAGVALDWDRVDILPSDERWVPESSDRSNARLIRRRLLTGHAAAARFHPLWRDTPQPEDVLDELTEMVTPHLPFNLLWLGMGADMHTASIFPDSDRLAEALAPDAPLLMPMRRPGEEEIRLTITLPYLTSAMSLHLLLLGEDKKEALMRARDLEPAQAPVAGVLANATIHYAD